MFHCPSKLRWLIVSLLWTVGCGSPTIDSGPGAAGQGGGKSGSGDLLPVGGVGGTSASDASTNPRPGNGTPEICNGIDDDDNGIVDDVDVDKDGVCDCIRIATLGVPGTSGKGDVFGAWLSARASDGAKDLGTQVITADLIRNFQIIVVQDVREGGPRRAFSDDEVKVVENWVRAGGGLMTLIGYSDPAEVVNVDRLLAPFGMTYLQSQPTWYGGPITDFSPHPITAKVKAVGMNNGYAVEGGGTCYATNPQGVRIGVAQEVDKGRVNVWGDEWITYNSDWVERKDYQVELFWVNTIKWLTPSNTCQVEIPTTLIP